MSRGERTASNAHDRPGASGEPLPVWRPSTPLQAFSLPPDLF